MFFEFYDEDTTGWRPPCLGEPRGPLEGVQRHTVEHIVDVSPFVQILDVPVPQLGDQLVEFVQKLDTSTPVQVIEVPIPLDRIPQRFVDGRRPQRAEHLVEVPTDPPYALRSLLLPFLVVGGVFNVFSQNRVQLHRISMSRSLKFQFLALVVIVKVFKIFSQDKVRSILLSRSLTFLLVEVFKVFSLILVWQLLPQFRGKRLGKGFFHTFPRSKKSAEVARSSSARVHGHSGSSTLCSHQEARPSTGVSHEVEYFEYNGTWWGQQWDQVQQRYCWWLLDDHNDWCPIGQSYGGTLQVQGLQVFAVCRPRYPWLLRRGNDFCERCGWKHGGTPGQGAHCCWGLAGLHGGCVGHVQWEEGGLWGYDDWYWYRES